ncbi:MAG: hypothetical protein ACT4NU_13560 [Chromatiales bacterium]
MAVTANLDLGSVELPGLSALGVRAELRWDGDDRLRLVLEVAEVLADNRRYSNLRLQCAEAEWSARHLQCRGGTLAVAGASPSPVLSGIDFEYRLDSAQFRIEARSADLAGGKTDIHVAGDTGTWRAALAARGVQAAALSPLLTALQVLPEGYGEFAGTLNITAEARFEQGRLQQADLDLATTDLSFTGTHIADHADARVEATLMARGDALDVGGRAELADGAVYVEPGASIDGYRPGVTFEVADAPITMTWRARFDPVAHLVQIDETTIRHPRVASVALGGTLPLAADEPHKSLRVEIKDADLKQLYAAHLKQHCAHLPVLCGLELEGALDATMQWDGGEVKDLTLRFRDVYGDDERNRFRIAALNGDLILSSGTTPVESALRWESAGWYRLQVGGGSMSMRSHDRMLTVTRWSDLPLFDGVFKVETLEVASGGAGDLGIVMSGVLTPISMQDFTQAMGWPIMSGTLSGIIPGLSYRNDVLALSGDLLVRIFGGDVIVRGLRVENPLGQMPVLTTDVDIHNIDLEQLTGAFSFGEIRGKLEGAIHALRLKNWAPVAFDAWLQTPADDDTPHRISQKAVDNLSAIGSSGIGGTLSRGFLRVFKDYSYDQLGIRCRLEDGVCAMAGVAPAADGFYIVTRGGIFPPWIDVKGSGRKLPDGRYGIAWNDILLGLNRISSGQMQLQ